MTSYSSLRYITSNLGIAVTIWHHKFGAGNSQSWNWVWSDESYQLSATWADINRKLFLLKPLIPREKKVKLQVWFTHETSSNLDCRVSFHGCACTVKENRWRVWHTPTVSKAMRLATYCRIMLTHINICYTFQLQRKYLPFPQNLDSVATVQSCHAPTAPTWAALGGNWIQNDKRVKPHIFSGRTLSLFIH